jgi:hypothetical protein
VRPITGSQRIFTGGVAFANRGRAAANFLAIAHDIQHVTAAPDTGKSTATDAAAKAAAPTAALIAALAAALWPLA